MKSMEETSTTRARRMKKYTLMGTNNDTSIIMKVNMKKKKNTQITKSPKNMVVSIEDTIAMKNIRDMVDMAGTVGEVITLTCFRILRRGSLSL